MFSETKAEARLVEPDTLVDEYDMLCASCLGSLVGKTPAEALDMIHEMFVRKARPRANDYKPPAMLAEKAARKAQGRPKDSRTA